MSKRFHEGCDGVVARDAIVAYISVAPHNTAQAVVEALGLREHMQQRFIDFLRRHFKVEKCVALFIHGNLTKAGYQAISNIVAGVWDDANEAVVRLMREERALS